MRFNGDGLHSRGGSADARRRYDGMGKLLTQGMDG
jgi:hypothetical protein